MKKFGLGILLSGFVLSLALSTGCDTGTYESRFQQQLSGEASSGDPEAEATE